MASEASGTRNISILISYYMLPYPLLYSSITTSRLSLGHHFIGSPCSFNVRSKIKNKQPTNMCSRSQRNPTLNIIIRQSITHAALGLVFAFLDGARCTVIDEILILEMWQYSSLSCDSWSRGSIFFGHANSFYYTDHKIMLNQRCSTNPKR